jgi:predicted CXXCH cytochrome family protein
MMVGAFGVARAGKRLALMLAGRGALARVLIARLAACLLVSGGLACAAIAAGDAARVTPSSALAATGRTGRVESGRKFFADARYAGSESCEICHERQHAQWNNTWHAKMGRWRPRPEFIVGDFANRTIQLKNLRVRNKQGEEETISASALVFRKGDKFFFTLVDADNASNNQTYEVAKVLGGKSVQGHEARFGDSLIPAPLRWSVTQNDWLIGGFNPQDWFLADGTADGRPFRPDEMPMNRIAEAKCMGCHTTGFKFAKANGIWKRNNEGEIGVGCESCHGPGSRHVEEATDALRAGRRLSAGKTAIVNPLTDLNAEQATQVCGQCHGRGTHKEQPELAFPTDFLPGDTDLTSRFRLWSFSGASDRSESAFFWPNDWASGNRQQLQDFTKSSHYTKAGMSCITCHAPHGGAEHAQLRLKPAELCTGCHSANGVAKTPSAEMYEGSEMQLAGVACTDCHMARIGNRSRATSKSGHQWDTSSHVFKVATPAMEKALGVRSACAACHSNPPVTMPSGDKARVFSPDSLMKRLSERANEVRTGVDAVQAMLARVDMKRPGASALVREATAKINFVLMDNSKGAHNIDRAQELIEEAKDLAKKAAASR